MTPTTWRFLNGSEVYRIELPPGFDLDQTTTSVRVGRDGYRTIVFHPNPGAEEPADLPYLRHVVDRTSPDGLPVSIYEQRESQPGRLVFWRLKAGVLISAFNPEHHADIARFVDHVGVEDVDPPSISYGNAFNRGDQRERGQRDQVWFAHRSPARSQIIGLARLTGGRRKEPPQETSPTWIMRTAATPAGVLLWWAAPKERSEEIDRRIDELAESVRQA